MILSTQNIGMSIRLLVFSSILRLKKIIHDTCLKQTPALLWKGHADTHLQGGPVLVVSLRISVSA